MGRCLPEMSVFDCASLPEKNVKWPWPLTLCVSGLNAERAEDDNVAYMAQFDQLDMGLDFTPYDDPPPPYSPPKPPRVPMGEAPPPYEEALQTPGNNNNGEAEREASTPGSGENGPEDAVEAAMPHDQHSEAGVSRSSRRSSQTGGAVDTSSVDDVRCPDYRVTMAMSESSDTSPSQMVVRMCNNIPRASLVETSRAVMHNSEDGRTPSDIASPSRAQSANADMTCNTTSPQDTPHKRKDVRVAVDNSSNCRHGHDSPDSGRSSGRLRSSLHSSPETDDDDRDVRPAVHLSGRRRGNAGNGCHGNGRGGNRRSLGVQVFSVREIKDAAKSLRSQRSLPPTDLVLSDRHQVDTCATYEPSCSGAVQLDAARETGGSYPSEGACGGVDVHPHQPPVSSPSRPWPTPGGASFPSASAMNQPVVVSPFSPSPDSSVCQSPVFVRSSSVTSQFSVCSETGERRQYGASSTGRPMPFAGVRNYDNHPNARHESRKLPECRPGGSLVNSPMRQGCPQDNSVDNQVDCQRTWQSGVGRRDSNSEVVLGIGRQSRLDDDTRASNEPRLYEENNADQSTSKARVVTDAGSHDTVMVRSNVTPAAAAQSAKVTPLARLIYRDSSGLDNDTRNTASVRSLPMCHSVDGDSDTTPAVTRSPSGASPSRDTNRRAKRLSSGAACSPRPANETSPDHGFQHEKTTLRQLKKKKRRPYSTPGHPVDIVRTNNDLDNAQLHDKNKNSAASPGRSGGHRRTPKDLPNNSATYKEYGFIDTPESSMLHLANADLPESVSRYLALCNSQADDNILVGRENGTKHSRENSRERNQKRRDGSGSRQKKRHSRPVSAFDAVDIRREDVSCSPTRHRHNLRHYQN